MSVIGRYAIFTYFTYKDALLGRTASLRSGAGCNGENEHLMTEFFKPVDCESAEHKQMQARQRECMAAARRQPIRAQIHALDRARARRLATGWDSVH